MGEANHINKAWIFNFDINSLFACRQNKGEMVQDGNQEQEKIERFCLLSYDLGPILQSREKNIMKSQIESPTLTFVLLRRG